MHDSIFFKHQRIYDTQQFITTKRFIDGNNLGGLLQKGYLFGTQHLINIKQYFYAAFNLGRPQNVFDIQFGAERGVVCPMASSRRWPNIFSNPLSKEVVGRHN